MHLIQKRTCYPNLAAIVLALIGPLAACEDSPPEPPADTSPEVQPKVESTCKNTGRLTGSLSGAINIELDWSDDRLRCESMPRPDSEGIRLRFSSEVSGARLAIIIALPGLEAAGTGDGFDSNVTLTVEDSGRFFSTPDLNTCWADIVTNEPLADQADVYNVVGGLSCVSPLGEINGSAFIDIRDLRFSGVADWSRN